MTIVSDKRLSAHPAQVSFDCIPEHPYLGLAGDFLRGAVSFARCPRARISRMTALEQRSAGN